MTTGKTEYIDWNRYDYTGKVMTLASGYTEYCDSCTSSIQGKYIRVKDYPEEFIYCFDCGTEAKS